jgi:hypothetical protein
MWSIGAPPLEHDPEKCAAVNVLPRPLKRMSNQDFHQAPIFANGHLTPAQKSPARQQANAGIGAPVAGKVSPEDEILVG